MAGFCRRLTLFATYASFAAATPFAFVFSAEAQFLPPFGAAPPGEIVQRLRAEGYVLIHPLQRRDTVYLADVTGGPGGRERLVIDAWSGEILQRFLARREGFVPEGGEFSEPPPLGPPPERAFREGDYGYGPGGPSGGYEAAPKPRARPRPTGTARKGGEPKQTTPAAEPQNAGTGNPSAAPVTAAPTGPAAPSTAASPPPAPVNPTAAEPPKAETSPPNAASEPAKEVQPKAGAASTSAAVQSPAKEAAPTSGPAPSNPTPASVGKPGEKKVNDVPVNPLD